MRRNSSRIATRRASVLRMHAAIASVLCAAMSGACKSREPAPTVQNHAPAPAETSATPRAEPPKFRVRPEPTFELPDDVPADPADELRAMRHNCCDEMPASEIKVATRAEDATEAPTPTRTHGRSKRVDRSR